MYRKQKMWRRLLSHGLGGGLARVTVICLLSCSSYATPLVTSAQGNSTQSQKGTKDNSLCDPDSPNYLLRQKEIPWHKVPPKRVVLRDDKNDTSEASITVGGKTRYIYKTYMYLGGSPSYVIAFVRKQKMGRVDFSTINSHSLFELHQRTQEIVGDLYHGGGINNYALSATAYAQIRLWRIGSNEYFSFGKGSQFYVFEFTKNDIQFICVTKG